MRLLIETTLTITDNFGLVFVDMKYTIYECILQKEKNINMVPKIMNFKYWFKIRKFIFI